MGPRGLSSVLLGSPRFSARFSSVLLGSPRLSSVLLGSLGWGSQGLASNECFQKKFKVFVDFCFFAPMPNFCCKRLVFVQKWRVSGAKYGAYGAITARPSQAVTGPHRGSQALTSPHRPSQALTVLGVGGWGRLLKIRGGMDLRASQALAGPHKPSQALAGPHSPSQALAGPHKPSQALAGPHRPSQTLPARCARPGFVLLVLLSLARCLLWCWRSCSVLIVVLAVWGVGLAVIAPAYIRIRTGMRCLLWFWRSRSVLIVVLAVEDVGLAVTAPAYIRLARCLLWCWRSCAACAVPLFVQLLFGTLVSGLSGPFSFEPPGCQYFRVFVCSDLCACDCTVGFRVRPSRSPGPGFPISLSVCEPVGPSLFVYLRACAALRHLCGSGARN